MACYRMNLKHDEQIELKKAFFARYLNMTWKSLILKDDTFINDTFATIHTFLPQESPLCMIHKIMQFGCACLDTPLQIGISGDPSTKAYLDTLRPIINAAYTQNSKRMFMILYKQPHEHNCTGPKLQNLSQENPEEPIFRVD